MTPPHDLDAVVARRTRWVTRPLRRLVNAPHLLAAAIVGVWVTASMLYALLEDAGPIEGLWWGVVTGSTVGYGDFYPSTTAGRGIATVLILTMIVLLPIAIGHVIANIVLDRNQFTHDEQVALARAVEGVHQRVDRIEFLLVAAMRDHHGEEFVREALAEYEAYDAETIDEAEQMLEALSRAEE